MLTWEKNFKSKRADGRYTGSLGALFASMRASKPKLSFDASKIDTPEKFAQWKAALRAKLIELLRMPEATPQPDPVMLSSSPRDGYTLERWEFYPDSFSAIPVLILKPSKGDGPFPGVLCFPGSMHPKELLAGEPDLDNPNCHQYKYPDRNAQALHCVRQGYVAVAFDNPGTCELVEVDGNVENQGSMREKLVTGYIGMGTTYLGVSVFQKLRFLEWFKKQPWIDSTRIALIGHSLGSEPAMAMGVLRDDIVAVVSNDFVCDDRIRYCSMTNFERADNGGIMHYVPGEWDYFSLPDILAANAPKYLAVNEGGAEDWIDKIRSSYAIAGVPERLQVSYYPKYQTPGPKQPVPLYGLDFDTLYIDWCRVDVPDHSFRAEPSMKLLRKAFALS